MKNSSDSLENLYNTYSSMLYGIALEISPTPKDAKEILIRTFHQASKQNLLQQARPLRCAALIKLVIRIAQEQLHPSQLKNDFRLKQFEHTPLINKSLCGQTSQQNCGEKNELEHGEMARKVREEFMVLRNREK